MKNLRFEPLGITASCGALVVSRGHCWSIIQCSRWIADRYLLGDGTGGAGSVFVKVKPVEAYVYGTL